MPTVTDTNAKSAPSNSRPGLHIAENFTALLETGIDEAFQREFSEPFGGEQFFSMRTTNKDHVKFQSTYGLGHISQNRDTDVIPHDEKGIGFANEIQTYTYRGRVGIEKKFMETEQYGLIGDSQSELARASKRTVELIMADVFNRALGASGAPFVCEDGRYFIDNARANPFPRASNWSNLTSAQAITADGIFTEQLNFQAHTDERGHLTPLQMKKMVIRPADEQTVWEILKSDLRPADSMNARNFQFGRFEYEVYHYLTTANAFYMADGAPNELYFYWRVQPQFETFDASENPDVTWQRVRMDFGIGCGRPDVWRAHTVS